MKIPKDVRQLKRVIRVVEDDSPPPSTEQLREVVLLLRDLADSLVWCDQIDRRHVACRCVEQIPDEAYEVLDRLLPYRSHTPRENGSTQPSGGDQ